MDEGVFFFQDPRNFNDKRDCMCRYTYRGSEADWKSFIMNPERFVFLNRDKRRAFFKELKTRKFDWQQIYSLGKGNIFEDEKTLIRRYDDMGVLCLTANTNPEYMWREYGREGNGFCLGFELENIGAGHALRFNDSEFSESYKSTCGSYVAAHKVNYDDEPFVFNRLVPNGSPFDFFTTKETRWDKEDEWRLMMWTTDLRYPNDRRIHFHKDQLKSIEYGRKIDAEIKDKIKNIIEKKYPTSVSQLW